MTSCHHCGETSFYPSGPHTMGPCPLKQKEIEQRMQIASVEHEERLKVIREGREGREFDYVTLPIELEGGLHTHRIA